MESAVADDSGYAATGQTDWTFGELPEEIAQRRAGHEVLAYPALLDEGGTVGMGVFGSAEEAVARHRLGVRCLLLLALPYLAVWYVAWTLPLAAAEDDRGAQLLGLALCAYLLRQTIPL